MAYQSDTIASVINLLNVRYFLPAIQREYVWKPEQVIQLFDSIFSGYPTGSLLFWELTDENRSKYQVYKFIDEFQQNGSHNKLANTDGAHQLTLVIDGQQRLTSLLIGLKGTYILKRKFLRNDSTDSWTPHQLYINLVHTPDDEINEGGPRHGFEFHKARPTDSETHRWFRVSGIMDFNTKERFDNFLESYLEALPETCSRRDANLIRKNLYRLYEMVWKEYIIAYYTENQQDYDRVLNIFIRANADGTKLSKSDLLMSVITSHWKGINAREEIFGCVDRLNKDLTRKNNFDKDFIMKTCFVVCDLPITYKVSNFTNHNLGIVRENWTGLKKAIESAVDLANSFGIDGQNLTSNNAMIPLIYFLFHNPGRTLRTSTIYDAKNAGLAQRWLLMALLNRVFGSLGDAVLRTARDVLQEYKNCSADFPAEDINKALGKAGKTVSFDHYNVGHLLEIEYSNRDCFLALSLLYDEKSWGTMNFDKDHIFPSSLFQDKRMIENGISYEKRKRYAELYNRIGNLQLLLTTENIGKSDQNFGEWLQTREPGFRTRHLIPTDDSLLDLENFEEFIEAREDLIKERLGRILLV